MRVCTRQVCATNENVKYIDKNRGGSGLPEIPFAGIKDVYTEQQIGDCMRNYALYNTFCAVEKNGVEGAGHDSGKPKIMFQPEHCGADEEG